MGNIYFRKEAEEWNQAFPIGNGFLGAMVFGNVAKERIQVNEDSVWSGGFSNRVNPDAGRYLEKIRECLFEGNVQEAEKLAGYFFNLSQLTFTGTGVGGIAPILQGEFGVKNYVVIIFGIVMTIIFAGIANRILKY